MAGGAWVDFLSNFPCETELSIMDRARLACMDKFQCMICRASLAKFDMDLISWPLA
jgi:hypothetical protein